MELPAPVVGLRSDHPRFAAWREQIAGWQAEWETFIRPAFSEVTTPIRPEYVVGALADVLPDDVIAGTFGTVSALTLAGNDPDGREFVHFSPYAGGWGARARRDGNSAMVSLLSGDNYNVPCEVMETRFPSLLAESYALREGSAGAGRQRGGWGVAYDYRTLVPLELSVALDHFNFPPVGLFGGSAAEGSDLVIGPGTAEEQVLHQAAGVAVAAGTVVSHRTAGGGGYGDPFEREPAAVARDVEDELLTRDQARDSYGVAVGADGSVDSTETARLRAGRTDG